MRRDPTIGTDGDVRLTATHRQTNIIGVTDSQGASVPLHTFCLDAQGNILAGIGNEPGQIRKLDPVGNSLAAWPLDIRPEAVAVGPDNTVYVAGVDGIVVFSGEDEQKLLELPITAWQLFYNPVNGRLYAGVNDSIAVIDPVQHRVIGAVRGEVPFDMPQVFAFDSARNRLYAIVSRDDSIAFIDCERDSLLRTVSSGGIILSWSRVNFL